MRAEERTRVWKKKEVEENKFLSFWISKAMSTKSFFVFFLCFSRRRRYNEFFRRTSLCRLERERVREAANWRAAPSSDRCLCRRCIIAGRGLRHSERRRTKLEACHSRPASSPLAARRRRRSRRLPLLLVLSQRPCRFARLLLSRRWHATHQLLCALRASPRAAGEQSPLRRVGRKQGTDDDIGKPQKLMPPSIVAERLHLLLQQRLLLLRLLPLAAVAAAAAASRLLALQQELERPTATAPHLPLLRPSPRRRPTSPSCSPARRSCSGGRRRSPSSRPRPPGSSRGRSPRRGAPRR